MRQILFPPAFAIALALSAANASATLLAFEFAGSIDFDGLGFSDGDPVAGRLVYDDDIADASPDPNFGQFGNAAVKSFGLAVDGAPLTDTALGDSNYIVNRFGSDRVTFRTMNIAFDTTVSDCSDIGACLFSLIFIDLSDSILSTDAPPTLDALAQFAVIFGEITVSGTTVNFTVDDITEVQAATEPSAALLLGIGLLGLGIAARRRGSL